MRIAVMIFVFLLGGCVSVPSSPAPRFYMLKALDRSEVSNESNLSPDVIIAVGPVKIPEYQNRPQIVTQDRNKMLEFAQFDRWGEPLDQALGRLILENLSLMLPGATLGRFPYNYVIPVKYQIIAEVIKLESDLNGDVSFTVQWSVIDVRNNKMLLTKRSDFRQPVEPHSYPGLIKTLSAECASLSNEIAASLASLENHR
ncbi:MAG: PqiC family protein [Candidatus Omnitrophota bacterium]|jgi:uncharacterized lipoprotein YmbA